MASIDFIDFVGKYQAYILAVVSSIFCIAFLAWVVFSDDEGKRMTLGFVTACFIVLAAVGHVTTPRPEDYKFGKINEINNQPSEIINQQAQI